MEIIVGVQTLVIVLLGYWLYTLREAIRAQEKTIGAQTGLLTNIQTIFNTMQKLLESTDEPKMLERLEAYKQFVDREKDAALQEQAKQYERERQRMAENAVDALKNLLTEVFKDARAHASLISQMMPYIPPVERKKLLDSSQLESKMKELYYGFADSAPDLSVPENRGGLLELIMEILKTPPELVQIPKAPQIEKK